MTGGEKSKREVEERRGEGRGERPACAFCRYASARPHHATLRAQEGFSPLVCSRRVRGGIGVADVDVQEDARHREKMEK